MKMKRIAVAAALALGLVGMAMGPARTGEPKLVAVVAASNRLSSISPEDLREMILGRTRFWNDGRPVQVYLRPEGSPADRMLLRDVLHMTPAHLRHYWQELELSGRGAAPPVAYGPSDLVRSVGASPGGLSYMTEDEAVNLGSRVRVVPIK